MITYQDLLATGEDLNEKLALIQRAIKEHKSTDQYKTALDADLYYAHLNPTIMRYEKYIQDMVGKVRDTVSANHKIACRYYFFFITQLVQYLLSNGATFDSDEVKNKITNMDEALSKLATLAQNHGVAYGFYNLDHIDVFAFTEFVPFFDEENGSIRAGVRFWQLDEKKPLRITLYEEDGYTEYIKRSGEEFTELQPKRAYKLMIRTSEASGTEIYDGENYESFPIVPLYNINKQSELVGNKATIDAYDLVASKMTNNISEGDLIYWLIHNANGMTPDDDQKFLEMIHTVHIAHADEGQIEAKTIEIPHEATDAALDRLKKQLFDDFMAFDATQIAAGSVTATQINAAYQQLDNKADMFEYQIIEFVKGILELAGIDDYPKFKRNRIANSTEEAQTIMMCANILDQQTLLEHLPFLTVDEVPEIMERMQIEEMKRIASEPFVDGGDE
ncbi:phage portal protein [Treponema sp.]|uniref:phage portal protein n=1 Tax=Treponema sp. TaxID=166 RepID=UPI0038907865